MVAISVDLHREPSPQLVLRPAINRMGVPFLYDPSGREKTVLRRYIQHGIQRDLGFRPSDFPLFKPFSHGEVMKLTINVCFYISHDKDVDNMCKLLFDVLQGIIYENDRSIWELKAKKILVSPDQHKTELFVTYCAL